MTREEAKRIVKGYLSGLLTNGTTFADALDAAGIVGDDAHALRNAVMAVAYDLFADACADGEVHVHSGLRSIVTQVTGRAAA